MSELSELVGQLNKKSESYYHKLIKQLIYKFITNECGNIIESSTEKYFKNRRADVFFKFKNGQKAVVEIQHSKISIKEISARTTEYNQQGIYVLWILHGRGKCVAAHKFPEHRKNVKISTTEKFLHSMYGGRVYYVNVNEDSGKIRITPPFALHFSFNKKSKERYKKNFEYYYFRNSNFTPIPNWNIFCSDFNRFKIARFYDKNIKISLKNKILKFIQIYIKKNPQDYKKYRISKKLIKVIINRFNDYYGKPIIIESISLLRDIIEINEKAVYKFRKKYNVREKR